MTDIEAHVEIGTSTIGMSYTYKDNLDCMSDYKLREWKAAFGVRPVICTEAWIMISKQAKRKNFEVKHFYWALHFMRTYKTETELARALKTNPKTLRYRVKGIVKLLFQNAHRVVSKFYYLL